MQKKSGFEVQQISCSELIDGIKSNHGPTLKLIYKNNFGKVKRYVLQNNGNASQAKDVYQEAFVAMWKNVRNEKFNLHENSTIHGYLFQIAKYKWLDHLRSSLYKNTTFINREPEFESVEIEDEKEKNQRIKKVLEAVSQLDERCQKLLQLFYFEKKSYKEIGKILGLTEASARNAKYRCQEQLKRITQDIPNELE